MLRFQSKKPFSYFFLLSLLAVTVILFSVFAIIERLDILSSFICIIGINLLAFYLIGRYLCVLSLFDNKITVEFIYPFRIKKEYEFNGISEIDARGDNSSAEAMLGIEPNLNRGFYRLYLTDANGKLLNIKYNISEKDNKEFISLLKRKLTELSTD